MSLSAGIDSYNHEDGFLKSVEIIAFPPRTLLTQAYQCGPQVRRVVAKRSGGPNHLQSASVWTGESGRASSMLLAYIITAKLSPALDQQAIERHGRSSWGDRWGSNPRQPER